MELTYVVTGADRGLGLEFVRQIVNMGHRVFATSEKPSKAADLKRLLKGHGDRLCMLELDWTSDESMDRLADELHYVRVDVLINNPGDDDADSDSILKFDSASAIDLFNVHCLGPMRLVKQLLPALQAADHPLVVNIGSVQGSIALLGSSTDCLGRRVSQAAFNMASRIMANSLKLHEVTNIVISPCQASAEPGGQHGVHTVKESVQDILALIRKITPRDAGRFMDCKGTDIPW